MVKNVFHDRGCRNVRLGSPYPVEQPGIDGSGIVVGDEKLSAARPPHMVPDGNETLVGTDHNGDVVLSERAGGLADGHMDDAASEP